MFGTLPMGWRLVLVRPTWTHFFSCLSCRFHFHSTVCDSFRVREREKEGHILTGKLIIETFNPFLQLLARCCNFLFEFASVYVCCFCLQGMFNEREWVEGREKREKTQTHFPSLGGMKMTVELKLKCQINCQLKPEWSDSYECWGAGEKIIFHLTLFIYFTARLSN